MCENTAICVLRSAGLCVLSSELRCGSRSDSGTCVAQKPRTKRFSASEVTDKREWPVIVQRAKRLWSEWYTSTRKSGQRKKRRLALHFSPKLGTERSFIDLRRAVVSSLVRSTACSPCAFRLCEAPGLRVVCPPREKT